VQEDWDKILESDGELAFVDVQWDRQAARVNCPASLGLRLWRQGAEDLVVNGTELRAWPWQGLFFTKGAWKEEPPTLYGLRAEVQPAQPGLAGGQPYAVVTWETDQPTTTQVEFLTDDGLVRRTPFVAELRSRNRARADFLLPGKAYTFTAVSAAGTGKLVRETTRAETPGEGPREK